MRTLRLLMSVLLLALSVGSIGFLGAGCKSTPKVDWNSRVGTYTYDQAVQELGPPDKTATLSDGKKVADWIQGSQGSGLSFGIGTGVSSGGSGVGVGAHSGRSGYNDRVLRLTFDLENKLVSWSKNY